MNKNVTGKLVHFRLTRSMHNLGIIISSYHHIKSPINSQRPNRMVAVYRILSPSTTSISGYLIPVSLVRSACSLYTQHIKHPGSRSPPHGHTLPPPIPPWAPIRTGCRSGGVHPGRVARVPCITCGPQSAWPVGDADSSGMHRDPLKRQTRLFLLREAQCDSGLGLDCRSRRSCVSG